MAFFTNSKYPFTPNFCTTSSGSKPSGSETTLTIVSGYTDGIHLLYTNTSDEDISGCSVSDYYVIAK